MDRGFIEKIYEEYYSLIKLIVKNSIHTSNADDITSCVQDVFVVAMQKKGLENHSNIKAWLLTTTKNIVKTFNRQKAIRNKYYYDIDFDFSTVEPIAEDFSDLIIEKLESERLKGLDVNQAITQSLSQNERDFFALLLQKLSTEEISKILNISEGAVSTRRTRLKAKIKKVLQNL